MRALAPPWPGRAPRSALRSAAPADRAAAVPRQAVPGPQAAPPHGLGGGLVVGLMAVVSAVSFAALVYAGPLAPQIGTGLGFALLATAINILVVAALASLPGTVGGSQSLPAAIVATAAAGIAHDMAGGAGGAALSATVLVAMALCTVTTGAVLLVLGHWRAGRLVRLLPYPVIGGVVGATGWLLGQGALNMAVGHAPAWHALPAVGWALAMLSVCLRRAEPLRMLGMMVLGVLVFYAVARLLGVTPAELAQQGWLLQDPSGSVAAPAASAPDFGAIDWAALGRAAASLATVPLVTAISLMLNVAGLETTARRPLDMDRELRAAGLANVASGLGGGYVGYQQLGLSAMNVRDGASTRSVGLWAAIVCLAALAFGTEALAWLPRPMLGAQLLLLAVLVVRPWLLQSRGRLGAVDLAIVATIVLATAVFGFLSAVLLGLAAAVLLFAVQYGRVDPVRQVLSGADYGSRRERGADERRYLRAHGDAIRVLQLQGYIFFGMADRLQAAALRRVDDGACAPLRFVVLDCRRVSGCDSSAAQGLLRLKDLLDARGCTLVVCQASAAVARQLAAAGLDAGCPRFDDLDHGLEWCETALLPPPSPADTTPAQALLARTLGGTETAAALLAAMERVELQPGEVLIAQGSASCELYLLESGTLSARRERAGAPPLRLQTVDGSGEVFGEVGFFLHEPRTAEVAADTPCVVWQLRADALQRLERECPAAAAVVLRLLAERLSARVSHLVSVIDALEDR